jgi:hypothetical protein
MLTHSGCPSDTEAASDGPTGQQLGAWEEISGLGNTELCWAQGGDSDPSILFPFSEGNGRSPRLCTEWGQGMCVGCQDFFPCLGQGGPELGGCTVGDPTALAARQKRRPKQEKLPGKWLQQTGEPERKPPGVSWAGEDKTWNSTCLPCASQHHPCPSTVPQATSWPIVPSEKADAGGGLCCGQGLTHAHQPADRGCQGRATLGWGEEGAGGSRDTERGEGAQAGPEAEAALHLQSGERSPQHGRAPPVLLAVGSVWGL